MGVTKSPAPTDIDQGDAGVLERRQRPRGHDGHGGGARLGRAGPVEGSHVLVVRGDGEGTAGQAGHERFQLQPGSRVVPALGSDREPAHRSALAPAGAEAPETMGGEHTGTGRQLGEQPAHRAPLGHRQFSGETGPEEIGPARGPAEQ